MGWDGADVIRGGAGRDTLDGGSGDDLLQGGTGDDLLYGSGGHDILEGGDGQDTLYGSGMLSGGAGSDHIYASDGSIVDGGAGDDTLRIDGDGIVVFGKGSGHDKITYHSLYGNDRGYVLRADIDASEARILGGTIGELSQSLTLQIADTGDSIAGLEHVLEVVFKDGTRWTKDELRTRAQTDQRTTAHADTVLGTDAADVIDGGAGDDKMAGGLGDDLLKGGTGWDLIYGNEGNDTLVAGDRGSILDGDAGDDSLVGGAGYDTLILGEGNNVADGGSGHDYITGTRAPGVNTIRFGLESGSDTYYIDSSGAVEGGTGARVVVELGDGIDAGSITFERRAPYYWDEAASLVMRIRDTDQQLTFSGWFGQQPPPVEVAVRFADGTSWSHEYIFSAFGEVLLPSGGFLGDYRDNRLEGTETGERIAGFTGDDTLIGHAGNDTLQGGLGHDSLLGGDGADSLRGDAGRDTFDGGAGNDTFDVSESQGEVDEVDTLVFGYGSGADVAINTRGRDVIQLGEGIRLQDLQITVPEGSGDLLVSLTASPEDTLRLSGWRYGTDRLHTLRLADGTVIDLEGSPSGPIIATDGSDSISDAKSSPFADAIYGLGGNDALYGGDGNDSIHGGAGNDYLNGGSGRNLLDGGSGDDTYAAQSGDTVVFGFQSGRDSLSSAYDNPGIIAFEANVQPGDVLIDNILFNSSGFYFWLGLKGSDARLGPLHGVFDADGLPWADVSFSFGDGTVVEGRKLFSTFYRGAETDGRDILFGTGANNDIDGGAGDDRAYGAGGDDKLAGGRGTDTLFGGAGRDTLVGGAGDDLLAGGGGHDLYRFENGFGRDTVDVDAYNIDSFDSIEFGEGIRAEDVAVKYDVSSNYTLQPALVMDVGGQQVRVNNGWASTWAGSGNGQSLRLDEIRFADGTVWTTADIAARLIVPTTGNDTLVGSDGDDQMVGQDGDDWLDGATGHDTLLGGRGDDLLTGGAGRDQFQGGVGQDVLDGGDGSDTYVFHRGDGQDTITDFGVGDRDVDTLIFGEGISVGDVTREIVDGKLILHVEGTGDTVTIFGHGQSSLSIERIRFADGTVLDPVTWAPRHSEVGLLQGSGAVEVPAGSVFDTLRLGEGIMPDSVSVSRQGDDLVVRSGADSLRFAHWYQTAEGVVPLLQVCFDQGTTWTISELLRLGSIRLGSMQDDRLVTNGSDPVSIDGQAGHDHISGGSGDDHLVGVEGNDTLIGGMGADLLEGGAGDDLYVVDDLDQIVEYAGGGNDMVRLLSSKDVVVTGEIEGVEVLGSAAINITGNASDNHLIGNTAANRIDGGEGNDTLDGGGGADHLVGGTGDDRYVVDNAADTVVELSGEGNDTIASYISRTLAADDTVENLELLGEGNVNAIGNDQANILIGNGVANVIRGMGGNDRLDGGGGADRMSGGTGDDIYIVDDGADQVIELGGEGIDLVQASANFTLTDHVEHLMLTGTGHITGGGNALDNRLTGNGGDNELHGLEGADTLAGGAGTDLLNGGEGNDQYNYALGDGQDTVSDADSTATAASSDLLVLQGGILPADLIVRRVGDDLMLSLRGTQDRLTILNHYVLSGAIETIRFGNGTEWKAAQIEAAVTASGANTAPVLTQAQSDLLINSGAAFELDLRALFSDADAGDSLIPRVILGNGDALPGWLCLDAQTGKLYGTPGDGDVGTLSLKVVVADSANQSAMDEFNLSIRNPNDTSPVVWLPLADQRGRQGDAFNFSLPVDAFKDFDAGDSLAYSATLSNGQALPDWLRFDSRHVSFSGTPGRNDVGSVSITVTARDTRGRSASDTFEMIIDDVNDPPRVQRLVGDQVMWQGQQVDLTLPTDFFVDREGTANITAVTLATGEPLPAWLTYDPLTRRLTGTADASSVGVTAIRVTGADEQGLSAFQDFNVVVGDLNDAPVLTGSIDALTTREGRMDPIALPTGVFSDPDRGDALSYSLQLLSAPTHAKNGFTLSTSNGALQITPQRNDYSFVYSALDYWDVGTWTFKLTATDRLGLSVSTQFTVDVQGSGGNHGPVWVPQTSLPWQVNGVPTFNDFRDRENWGMRASRIVATMADEQVLVPVEQFIDVDHDTLSFTVLLKDSDTLGDWVYDAQRHTLQYAGAGVPPRQQDFDILVDDGKGGRSMAQMTVLSNRIPTIAEIPEIVVREDEGFEVTLPGSLFQDPDGDPITVSERGYYTALRNYNQLGGYWETWGGMRADADGRYVIYGNPGNFAPGTYYMTLQATDNYAQGSQEPDGSQNAWVDAPTRQVKVTVLNTYDAPILKTLLADQAIKEGDAFSVWTASNFLEMDADQTLRYTARLSNGQALPSWLSIDTSTGQLHGTANPEDVGDYAIQVTVADLAGASVVDEFNLSVSLSDRNHAPRLALPVVDQVYRRNQEFSFQLPRSTFADIDGNDVLSFTATLVGGGALPSWITFNASTLTFSGHVPVTQQAATEIVIVATDRSGATASDVFSLGIDEKTLPPVVAQPIADTTAQEDSPFSFVVPSGTFNDAEASGALSLTAVLASGASLPAWLSFDPASRTFLGTPANADVGLLQVRVTATEPDGGAVSDIFQITVANVNDVPTVAGESLTADRGGLLLVAAEVLLANDNDIDPTHDTLVISEVGDAEHGAVMFTPQGAVQFQAEEGFVGTARFSYTVSDGKGGLSKAYVNVEVARADAAPVALDGHIDLDEDTQRTLAATDFGFRDVDGPAALQSVFVNPVVGGGSLSLNGQMLGAGTWVSRADLDAGRLTFRPGGNASAQGYASLSFKVDNGLASDNTASLTFNVKPVNDAPMVVADTASVQEDVATSATGNLLGNDSDVDGNALAVKTPGTFVGTYGTLVVQADGSYAYSLNNGSAAVQALRRGQQLTDSFTVDVTDGIATTGNALQVTITGSNDAPVVVADTASVQEDVATSATGNLLGNDSDVDADVLAVKTPGTFVGAYGTLVVQADGSYAYSLNNGSAAVQALKRGQQLTDSFTVGVTDGIATTGNALQVTITGSNDAPVVVADTASVQEDVATSATGNLLGNDSDVDGDALAVKTPGTFVGTYGTLVILANGSYSYSLDNASPLVQNLKAGEQVVDSFSIDVTDGTVAIANVLQVTVKGNGDAPTTQVDLASVREDSVTSASGNVLSNDAGDQLSLTTVGTYQSSYGTLVLQASGAYTYTLKNGTTAVQSLAAGQQLTDVFTYTVRDDSGLTASSSLRVSVTGSNDAPALAKPIADRSVQAKKAFIVDLPDDTFADIDQGAVLSYTATLADGSVLPSWLSFNANGLVFSGTPVQCADGQTLAIQLKATDQHGASVIDTFKLGIASSQGVRLTGSWFNDTLVGTERDDVIDGSLGSDRMIGGDGDDTYVVGEAPFLLSLGDQVVENANEGYDTVQTRISYTLTSNVEALQLTGLLTLSGTGNSLDNWLVGNDVGNILSGLDGNDLVSAGCGNDLVYGGNGADVLEGQEGWDVLKGGAGNDALFGGQGLDKLHAEGGAAFLAGGDDCDDLYAGSTATVIAFNRGDDADTVYLQNASPLTLSFGGGIKYQDVGLRRVGNDLYFDIECAPCDSIRIADYYEMSSKPSLTLQFMVEPSGEYAAGSQDKLRDNKVERFDGNKIVADFNAALADANCLRWGQQWHGLMSSLLQAQFTGSGSDNLAVGGDLAYAYAMQGSAGMTQTNANNVLTDPQFALSPQVINRPLIAVCGVGPALAG